MVNLSDRKHVLRVEKAIGNPIKKISEKTKLGYLDDGENVIELRLPRMGIEEFPMDICNLPHLRVLDLNFNKIGQIPNEIGKLRNLEELYIGQSMMDKDSPKIESIPEGMTNLSNLRVLDLTGHSLEKLPKWVSNFMNLERLFLGGNGLKDLPSEIGKLTRLEELQLWSNQLKKLPKTMKNLSTLKVLLLSKNNLKEMPKWMGELSFLERVDFEENELKKIPKEIENLTNLVELNLASNFLEKLPDTFCNLKKVEQLDLSGNHFKEPLTHQCIETLESLKWINIETQFLSTDAMALLIDREVTIEGFNS